MNDNVKKLYDTLSKDGYDTGEFNSFASKIQQPGNLRKLYDVLAADNYDVGEFEGFSNKLFSSPVLDLPDTITMPAESTFVNNPIPAAPIDKNALPRFGDTEGLLSYNQEQVNEEHAKKEAFEKQLDEAIQDNAKKKETDYKKPGLGSYALDVATRVINPALGAVPMLANYYMNQPESYRDRRTAGKLLEDAKNMKEMSQAEKEQGDWRRFFSSFGRTIKDEDTLTLGFTEIDNNVRLIDVSKKYEKVGFDNLSPSEQELLQAATIKAAAEAYYAHDIGIAQKSGQSTAASIPYMLQFLATSGIGSVASTGVRKALMSTAKHMLKKGVNKELLKIGTSLASNAAKAAAMTPFQPAMYEDITSRLAGNASVVSDKDGRVQFIGMENQAGLGEAIAKGFGSTAIENFSEMSGEYLGGVGRLASKYGKKIPKVGGLIDKAEKNQLLTGFNKFSKDLGWHGTMEEFFEEQVGTGLNALLIGDSKLGDMVDGQQQLATLLSVAAMGGAFVAGNSAVGAPMKRKIRQEYDNAKSLAQDLFGAEEFDKFRMSLSNLPIERRPEFIQKVADAKGFTNEQLMSLGAYAVIQSRYEGYVGGIRDKINEEVVKTQDDMKKVSNPVMGAFVTVTSPLSDKPVNIVGGYLAFTEDGFVDAKNSSQTIYYLDKDGKRQMASPDKFEELSQMVPLEEMYARAMTDVTERIVSEEESLLDSQPFKPNDIVTTPDGFSGMVTEVKADEGIAVVKGQDGTYRDIPLDKLELKQTQGAENTNIPPSEPVDAQQPPAGTQQTDASSQPAAEAPKPNFPLTKSGDVDYDQITDPQMYADALVVNFGEEALDTVNELISEENARLEKAQKKANAIDRRLTMKKIKAEIERLGKVRQILSPVEETVTPATEEGGVPKQEAVSGTPVPHESLNDREYAEWALEESENSDELLGAYEIAKESGGERNKLLPWQKELLGKKINPESFYRFGDRNKVNGSFARAWLKKDGYRIDTYADELSELGVEVTPEDIVDFMLSNPTNYVRKTSDLQKALGKRWAELATKEAGVPIGNPESATGKVFIAMKKKGGIVSPVVYEEAVQADYFWEDEKMVEDLSGMPVEKNQEDRIQNEEEAAWTPEDYQEIYEAIDKELNVSENEKEGTGFEASDTRAIDSETGREVGTGGDPDGKADYAGEDRTSARRDSEAGFAPNGRLEAEGNVAGFVTEPSVVAGSETPLETIERVVAEQNKRDAVASAEKEVDVHPTEAQKEAGNYKKGHVKVNGFDITIEQPAGSVRSGKDASGKEWSVKMNNTYGYFKGTKGKDGDHIDVFLGSKLDSGKVFVVDRVNPDGSFDEHKVMMGFDSVDEAKQAYLSNYEEGWSGLGAITPVSLDEFKKWIASSTRKTKPFVEYKSVTISDVNKGYTIEKRHHEKKNKNIYAVNFDKRYSRDEFLKIKAEAKTHGGYYSSFGKKGYIFDEFESAEKFAESVSGMKQAEEAVTFETPLIENGEDILEYISRVAEKKMSFDNKGYKVGDKVLYKGVPATITDFENDGRPILDTGNAPVLYEIANWDDIHNLSETNVPLKVWSDMSAEERMVEAEKAPLSEDEITNAPTDEVNKANAIDYLRGNHGFIQSISYLKVYEDVRNSNRNTATDSSSTNTSQLDEAGNRNGDGLGAGREGRKSPEPVDRRNGSEDVSRQRIDGSDRERSLFDNIGEGGDSNLPSSEQPVDAVSSGSTESGRGSDAGGTGSDGGQRRRKAGPNHATTDGRRDTDARRSLDARTSTEKTEVDAEIDAALKEFDDILSEFKHAGKETLNLSLVGMNSRQMEILPRLISAGAKVGYAYIKKGIYSFAEWMKQMREAFGDKLHAAGLSNTEVDAFITEMWKSKLPMNGEMHTLEEWASILGKADLRKKISSTLDEKRKAQYAAENVKVKVCDKENIAETLPFLLPQQQDDVLKAELQFFDEGHNDREHAFGKGYMFTNGTGTGKTYTGLGIVKRFIKRGKGRILILTPSQTKVSDWIKDAANLHVELNDLDAVAKAKKDGTTATTEKGEGAVITTYANFRQNQALLEDDFDLIVYDESHRLLENKGGIGTTGAEQHYKISNRNENYAFLRLQNINSIWKTLKAKEREFDDKRNAVIARLQKETGITSELTFEQRGELPPVFNGGWNESAERKFPEIANLRKKIIELYAKYNKEVKPELERQAKESVKRTKTVFLSATPFNTRENLDYVEGYIFSYPESEKQDGYSVQSPRSQFYLEHFGAGYKWRYHRLENSGSNPEAVSKQEIRFSDYLQHTLQTMSGRIIDSPYDYSRDFPTVTMDKAEEFNNAMEELAHESATGHAFYAVMGDYNYTGALFESMKVAQIIPRLKEHLARGRKAVIFHRRMESKNPVVPPFSAIFAQAMKDLNDVHDASERDKKRHKISALRRKYAGMLEWEQSLDLRMPREQLADAFGKNDVLFFSGKESKKTKDKAVDDFNNDDSGKNIIVIQEASGKEGISLHDVTGKHQRVLITLALPQSPITALQIEGRIYRIGNKSNAIFEYPLLGLNTELMLFGQKFNQQVSTTENLALGSQGRNLRESFSRGVEERSGNVDVDNQGVGGKEFDAPNPVEENLFDNAVLDYYTNQKLTGKRDEREGIDFYPTPEPLGFMLNQWGRISEGESVLEPSAGHGAIARYVPRENPLTAVEPSQRLFSKLQIKAGGNGRKFENTIFENYNVVNKHDVVLMNPPFGTGGKLAVEHVAKAFQHLEEGGRIVAIIPRGSTDKKFDKWCDEQKNAALTAEIRLPDITFERAGTNVSCRTVVIDKVTNENLRSQAASNAVHVDLSTIRYDKIEDFFEDIRNISVPERTIDQKAKLKKKAAPVARELRTVKGVKDVLLTDERIYVSGRGVWASIEWGDKKGDALTSYLSEEYKRFLNNYDYAAKEENESREVVYGEMKALACKLAGMTEDEMQRYISRKNDDIRYRFISEKGSADLNKEVTQKFNEELQQQIEGTLPKGHVYALGKPGVALLSAGIPDLPIELAASRLEGKSRQENHPFELSEIKNLPEAIQNPLAVFRSATHIGSFVVMTEIEHKGKNFVVAIEANRKRGKIEVNSIRSVHYRTTNAHMANWINEGLLEYVDKQRMSVWLSKQRYNSADVRQLYGHATKIVNSFDNPTFVEGKKIAEVKNLSSELNTPVRIVRDVNNLPEDARKRRAKGYYDPKTGETVIVLPNNTDVADVQKTLLHEIVAHKGLRGLLGDKLDDMLDRVFAGLPEKQRAVLAREAYSEYKGNVRVATEEYLARIVEKDIQPTVWEKVKSAIRDFFRSLGIELRMTDADIQYLLWKSKNRLKRDGSMLEIVENVARDADMKERLYREDNPGKEKEPLVSPEQLARENPIDQARIVNEALELSEEEKNDFSKKIKHDRFREGWQDRFISVLRFQELIAKKFGRPIKDFCNAYIFENTIASRSTYEIERYKQMYLRPLLDIVARLGGQDKVADYMKAKHGLERNEVMRARAIERRRAKLESRYEALKESLKNKLSELENQNGVSQAKINTYTDSIRETLQKGKERMEESMAKYEQRQAGTDYSGLTGLQQKLSREKNALNEGYIRDFVDAFEKDHNVKPLWDAIRKSTRFSLEKQYLSGCIDKKTLDHISGMYEYYIPLREWEEDTAEDFYDYFFKEGKDTLNDPLKKTKGRKSEAGDPFANIASMASSAIFIGNKNLMKQHFLRLVTNYKTNLATVSDSWYIYEKDVDGSGVPGWREVRPEFREDMTEEEQQEVVEEFNARMKELQQDGLARTELSGLDLGVPIKPYQAEQHVIKVKENGVDKLIFIQGNPRVAQAINGLNNVRAYDSSLLKAMSNIKQFMTQNFTTRNPTFVARNLSRDMIYAVTMHGIREGGAYTTEFLKAIPGASGAIARYLRGKADMSNEMDKMFDEFLGNGGETGFVALTSYETYKKEIRRMVNKAARTNALADSWEAIGKAFEGCNRWAEDLSRFATYVASRKAGRSVMRSVSDAKEVTVNFNRKGSGAYGGWIGNLCYFFLNAGMQGMHNFGRTFKARPVKTTFAMTAWAMLGALMPDLISLLYGDDEDYNNIPDHVRQNSIVIPMGGGYYFAVPLSIEVRAFYGIGDIIRQIVKGNYNDRATDAASDIMERLMDLTPRNFIGNSDGGGKGVIGAIASNAVPDVLKPFVEAYVTNSDFTGRPIVKDMEYNKYEPEYQRVYKGTAKELLASSEFINQISDGDYATKGWADSPWLNPAAVEHLFESYFGGVGKTIMQTKKTIVSPWTEDFALRNVPVVSGFTYELNPAYPNTAINERYQVYTDWIKEMQSRERMYDKGMMAGEPLEENYKTFMNSRKREVAEIAQSYKELIDGIGKEANLAKDKKDKERLYAEITGLKKKMLEQIDNVK